LKAMTMAAARARKIDASRRMPSQRRAEGSFTRSAATKRRSPKSAST
jgi:hypothetical protein